MKRSLQRYLMGISAACIGSVASLPARAQSVTFIEPTPGNDATKVFGLSGDGASVIVGVGGHDSNPSPAFQWSKQAGFLPLDTLPEETAKQTFAISRDGSVIVGSTYANGASQPYRWSAATGIIGLGNFPLGDTGQARGVSADGSVVVGYSNDSDHTSAFRWTQATGLVSLGTLPDCTDSFAYAVSADGSVVVGTCFGPTIGHEPFRWTAQTGMLPMGIPEEGAEAISADGAVVIGYTFDPNTYNAQLWWTSGNGFTVLPSFLYMDGMNHDGSIMVGEDGFGVDLIWDPLHGTRDLKDVFRYDYGLGASFGDLQINGPVYISDDGLTFAGNAMTPLGDYQGWIATVPEPHALLLLTVALSATGLKNRRKRG